MNPLLTLILLIAACGFFALAEMALAASRKSRLQQLADAGDKSAACALAIKSRPSRFIAATQTGLTTASLLSGIFGEEALAAHLKTFIDANFSALTGVSSAIAFTLTITVITAAAIVFGEIIPKRIALAYPEEVAKGVAPFMRWFIMVLAPAIRLLSWSADLVLGLLPIRSAPAVTGVEDILALVDEGELSGSIGKEQSHMLWNVFRLEDRHLAAVMTPVKDVALIDLAIPHIENLNTIRAAPHGRYPICRGGLQQVLGLAESRAVLKAALSGEFHFVDLPMSPPVYVPSALTLIELLRIFREQNADFAFVVNEFGVTEGIVTLSDLFETVAGDMMPGATDPDQALAVQRDDGSWLLDGLLPMDEMKEKLGFTILADETQGRYHTVGGFVVTSMGKIPKRAEKFVVGEWEFEVVNMDHNRVDEVIASKRLAI
ncbi:MAG: hemolysin family protein [Rhodoferax sp.]|uniref:hemolysin family protein n=1 Tax=Rhodoferax sp. TaxID=50421 RepID=UPI00301ACE4C